MLCPSFFVVLSMSLIVLHIFLYLIFNIYQCIWPEVAIINQHSIFKNNIFEMFEKIFLLCLYVCSLSLRKWYEYEYWLDNIKLFHLTGIINSKDNYSKSNEYIQLAIHWFCIIMVLFQLSLNLIIYQKYHTFST